MRGLRHIMRTNRGVTALVLALALAVRLLTPAGTMLATSQPASGQTASGLPQLAVLLCDGSGPIERRLLNLPLKTGPADVAPSCPFAALAFAIDVPVVETLAAERRHGPLPAALAGPIMLRLATARHLYPPSQGPPAIA